MGVNCLGMISRGLVRKAMLTGGGTTESHALPLQVGIVVGWYPSSNRRASQREVLGERPKPLLLFLRAAFKFGRRVHFALQRKMLKLPIARLPAI